MVLEIGAQIGDYRILSRIGKGTFGIVFEASHIITQRVDALKVMLDAACPPDEEHRFLREIQAHASLQHPNIATVYHAFRSPHGLALVMELVRGESLRAKLDRGKMPLAEGLRYILQTLAGLDYAERRGVIHRDIKPENILITQDGEVKLTDFGLAHVANRARITGSGESLGTPWYMSPEQIDGIGEVDARTDVYSIGVVLYEITTGRVPFQGTNGFAVMLAHRQNPPTPPATLEPTVGPALNSVILKALEKNPSKRFSGSAEFRAAILHAYELGPAPSRFGRARSAAAALAGFGICSATLAGGYWKIRQSSQPAVHATKRPAPASMPTAAPTPASAEAAGPVEKPAANPETADHPSPPRTKRAFTVAASRKNAAPVKSSLPRISGMQQPSDAAPAHEAAQPSAPEPPPLAETVVEPPTPVQQPPAIVEAEPPSPPKPEAAPAPKKRNAVVRALGKLFGKREKPAAGADTGSSNVKATSPSTPKAQQ